MTSLKKSTLLVLLMLMTAPLLLGAAATDSTTALPNLPMRSDNNVEDLQVQNRKIIALVVQELSKDLPKTIDKYTKFVNIKSDDLTLIYTFEINTGSKSDKMVQQEDHARMQAAVTQGVCRSSQRFLDAQINIAYVYHSAKTKTQLFRFDITQADCLKSPY